MKTTVRRRISSSLKRNTSTSLLIADIYSIPKHRTIIYLPSSVKIRTSSSVALTHFLINARDPSRNFVVCNVQALRVSA
jgi:hypothetical protein